VNATLEALVKSELDQIGYDLVRIRQGGPRSRPILEIRIDRRDGHAVMVEDCARASRAVAARLDAGVPELPWLERRYELQVSSPGDARRGGSSGGAGGGSANERTNEGGEADGRIS
jgi:ribosome maturation factor RimP